MNLTPFINTLSTSYIYLPHSVATYRYPSFICWHRCTRKHPPIISFLQHTRFIFVCMFHCRYSSVRCSAYTGFRGRRVTTALITRTCLNGSNSVGNIAHEMGHVIGFNHEHNRPDRNSYITMHRGNILSYSAYMVDTHYDYFGTPYDLDSIMHYPPISGGDAVNPSLPVFTLKDDIVFNGTIGQRQCLSYYDIIATNQLYRCNRTTPPKTSCNFHEWYMMPTNQSGSGATPQPLNTTTETSSNNSNFIYPGDTVAFKSTLSSSQRWIGCTDESMCFAWGCPGRAFALINQSRCWEFQFVVSPVRVISTATTPLRFGDRVVLQQCRSFTSSTANCTSFVPLSCPGDGEQCSFVDEECCGSDSWRHTAAGPRCQHSIFRLVSPDGGTHILEHRHRVMLVDDSSTPAHQSLCCYVRNERKRKKTCQLQPYNVCNGPEHHFQIFKL
jgi:hypothetical protein